LVIIAVGGYGVLMWFVFDSGDSYGVIVLLVVDGGDGYGVPVWCWR
jgi:hypothetical protein